MPTILDSNVVLDILHEDAIWFSWSARQLRVRSEAGKLVINAIIFAEASLRYSSFGEYRKLVASVGVELEDIPWEAAFMAGQAQDQYRLSGGRRERVLADFLIGAHAAIRGYAVLTRDQARYRTYFPRLDIIAPDTHR